MTGFQRQEGPEVDQREIAVQIIALTERLETSGQERENGKQRSTTFGRMRWRGSRNVIADSCER
jgi:hypothetical protein